MCIGDECDLGIVSFKCSTETYISYLYNYHSSRDYLVIAYHERPRYRSKRYRLSCTPDQLSGHVPRNLSLSRLYSPSTHLPRNNLLADRIRGLGSGWIKMYANPSYSVVCVEKIAHNSKSSSQPSSSSMTYIDIPEHSIVVSIDRGGTFTDVYA